MPGPLQKAFERHVQTLTQRMLREVTEKIIRKKFTEAERPISESAVVALVHHFLSGSADRIAFGTESSNEPDIEITITDEDLTELDRAKTRLLDMINRADIDKVGETTSRRMLSDLKREWRASWEYRDALETAFRMHLEERWGAAFDTLRVLIEISRQTCDMQIQRLRRSKVRQRQAFPNVIIRLHVRACQVASEVAALLDAGFADGAAARWRTLHEILVVGMFISEFGEDLARRYLDHEAIAQLDAAKLHQKTCHLTKQRPFSAEEFDELQANAKAMIEKYGLTFCKEYGWAADHLKHPNPRFSDLEAAVNRTALRPQYKLASYNVHAGSRGLFFKYGSIDGDALIAGASNSGFEEPGIYTVQALVGMNSLLFPESWQMDELVFAKINMRLLGDARREFNKAANKLYREEQAERREKIKKRKPRGK